MHTSLIYGCWLTISRRAFAFWTTNNLIFCPILPVLALAIHDDALQTTASIDEILSCQVPHDRRCLKLDWKKTALDKPIFRQPCSGNERITTSRDQPLRAHTAAKKLRDVGKALGFSHSLSQGAVRRGTGNAVDGESTETSDVHIN